MIAALRLRERHCQPIRMVAQFLRCCSVPQLKKKRPDCTTPENYFSFAYTSEEQFLDKLVIYIYIYKVVKDRTVGFVYKALE